ncbi:MAG: ribonuclease HII [Meiothermus sp.]|nr:ribonuclease HII [Meiothermus sp.]
MAQVLLEEPPPSGLICGVDEVGRGAGAGEVYAAAVILDADRPIAGLADSKQLSAATRAALSLEIKARARAWAIGRASLEEISALNVLGATLLAMQRAVQGLAVTPELALVDGNRLPKLGIPARAVVRGDVLEPAISAASILAKVARDAAMVELHARHPQYGFDRHKGYLTAAHLEALKTYGVSPVHRRGYAPIRALLESTP